jgi:uncharacterized BrkB/YihY/UPF0761 family membrane protein
MATITQNNTLAALILAAGLGPVAAQDAALETQIVDAMNKVYGVHPGLGVQQQRWGWEYPAFWLLSLFGLFLLGNGAWAPLRYPDFARL